MSQLITIRQTDFGDVLEAVHDRIVGKFNAKAEQMHHEAKELQFILQDIKNVSMNIKKDRDKLLIPDELVNSYLDLLDTIKQESLAQRSARGGYVKGKNNPHYVDLTQALSNKLFRRKNGPFTYQILQEAASVFEEEMGFLIVALEKMASGKTIDVSSVIEGNKTGTTRAVHETIDDDFTKQWRNKSINLLAEKERQKTVNYQYEYKDVKSDISGDAIDLRYEINVPQLQRLRELLAGKHISLKNYQDKVYDDKGNFLLNDLHLVAMQLGNSNLFKAITGALDEIYMGQTDVQEHIFYRGMWSMLRNTNGHALETRSHFNHLRFVYELIGSGLVDKQGNAYATADFIIENNPNGPEILVQDAATLIIKALANSMVGEDLWGPVKLAADKLY